MKYVNLQRRAENQIRRAGEKPEMNKAKPNYCNLHSHERIVIFE